MSDDILKQLRRTNGYDLLREEPIYVNPDGPKAADEIERLRAELAAAKAHAEEYAKEAGRMDTMVRELRAELAAMERRARTFEAANVKILVERDALRAQLAKAREALEPFAEVASSYDPDEGDGKNVAWAHDFTIGSLRRARAVLEKIKGGVDE